MPPILVGSEDDALPAAQAHQLAGVLLPFLPEVRA
jgi:hypothetical protein